MPDEIIRGLAARGNARVVAAVTTEAASEGARRHGCVGAASVALGRGLTAGALLATLAKAEERVTIQLLGDGPLGGLTVDAAGSGNVRGYVTHPAAFAKATSDRRTQLGQALGRNGVVNVVRDLGLRDRYSGQLPLVTGEVDEDVEAYLCRSEQIDSAVGCEVVLRDAFDIASSAGILVQALPMTSGAPDEGRRLVHDVQHRLRTGELYEALAGAAPEGARALAERFFHGAELQVLEARPVAFACRCTRERVVSALQLLGAEELERMIADGGRAEVSCNFCNERYELSRSELQQVRQQMPARGST